MRPLSAVPISTLPGCNAGAIEKAVTVVELQTTSVAPSGSMRNTALRAFDTSLRLRVGPGCACIGAPVSSMAVIVTEVLTVVASEGCGVAAGGVEGVRALAAASLSARA